MILRCSKNKNMKIKNSLVLLICGSLIFGLMSCKISATTTKIAEKPIPESFNQNIDSANDSQTQWRTFFKDKYLIELIDTAIKNNPDLKIALQNIEIEKNNTLSKKSLLFPNVNAGVGIGLDKTGRYTSEGAGNASTDMTPGNPVPEPLSDFSLGLTTNWEADIWGKLHNNKKAAYTKYLSSIEGKNFVITNLVAEIANSYYELLALDSKLETIRNAIDLQKKELDVVKTLKDAAVTNELAVKQFEAQYYNNQSMEYEVLQDITETENKINFLVGRFPQKIQRDTSSFISQSLTSVKYGLPNDLLKNRPDIKRAELEMIAAKCDVDAAKAEFYPSLGLSAALGFRAFKPSLLFTFPESILYALASDVAMPIINRGAIKAEFKNAKSYQIQAIYEYQKTILDAYIEVRNELSNVNNLDKNYNLKFKQSETLNNAVEISKDLFRSARANYLEVLTAQRDALDTKIELAEIKKRQFSTMVNLYKAIGGGWR